MMMVNISHLKNESHIVGILTFMSGFNSMLGLSEPKKRISSYRYTYEHLNLDSVEHEKCFITSRPDSFRVKI